MPRDKQYYRRYRERRRLLEGRARKRFPKAYDVWDYVADPLVYDQERQRHKRRQEEFRLGSRLAALQLHRLPLANDLIPETSSVGPFVGIRVSNCGNYKQPPREPSGFNQGPPSEAETRTVAASVAATTVCEDPEAMETETIDHWPFQDVSDAGSSHFLEDAPPDPVLEESFEEQPETDDDVEAEDGQGEGAGAFEAEDDEGAVEDEDEDQDQVEQRLMRRFFVSLKTQHECSWAVISKFLEFTAKNGGACQAMLQRSKQRSLRAMRNEIQNSDIPPIYIDTCYLNGKGDDGHEVIEKEFRLRAISRDKFDSNSVDHRYLSIKTYVVLTDLFGWLKKTHPGCPLEKKVRISVDGVEESKSGQYTFLYISLAFVGCEKPYPWTIIRHLRSRRPNIEVVYGHIANEINRHGFEMVHLSADGKER